MSLLALAALAVASPAPLPWDVSPERIRRDAAQSCARLFPDSMSLQVACRRSSRNGAAEFVRVATRYQDAPEMILVLDECVRLATDEGVVSFDLLGTCARVEERSFRQLAR